MALAPMGAYIPMVVMPAQFDAFMKNKGDFASFEGVIHSVGATWWAIPAMIIGTLVCAIIGGLIGKKLMKNTLKSRGCINETRPTDEASDSRGHKRFRFMNKASRWSVCLRGFRLYF